MSKYAPHRRSDNNPRATASTVCQKCLGTGHFIYECKSTRPYVSRPSRTEQLENPKVLAKLKAEGKPSVEVPEEFKNKWVLDWFFFLAVFGLFMSRAGAGLRIRFLRLKRRRGRNLGLTRDKAREKRKGRRGNESDGLLRPPIALVYH